MIFDHFFKALLWLNDTKQKVFVNILEKAENSTTKLP